MRIASLRAAALALAVAATLAGCKTGQLGGPDASPDATIGITGAGGGPGTGLDGSDGSLDGLGGTGGGAGPDPGAAAALQELRIRLGQAGAIWSRSKADCATYSYERIWTSVYGGSTTYFVEVRNDLPTRLHWIKIPNEGSTDTRREGDDTAGLASWTTLTVEGLIDECEAVLNHDPADYTFDVVFSARGVPTTCIARYMNCNHDCTLGIDLVHFDCSPLDLDGGAP